MLNKGTYNPQEFEKDIYTEWFFILINLYLKTATHFKECIFCFRTNNKIADYPFGYQDFLCSYGLKMPI